MSTQGPQEHGRTEQDTTVCFRPRTKSPEGQERAMGPETEPISMSLPCAPAKAARPGGRGDTFCHTKSFGWPSLVLAWWAVTTFSQMDLPTAEAPVGRAKALPQHHVSAHFNVCK